MPRLWIIFFSLKVFMLFWRGTPLLVNAVLLTVCIMCFVCCVRDVKDLIRAGCNNPVFCSVHEHSKTITPKGLQESYVLCSTQDKFTFLWSFIKHHRKHKILVFLATCKQVIFLKYEHIDIWFLFHDILRKVVDLIFFYYYWFDDSQTYLCSACQNLPPTSHSTHVSFVMFSSVKIC